MAPYRRATLAAILLLSGCALSGCSDKDPSGVTPQQWASTVCGSLNTWQTTIVELTTKSQLSMASAKTPPQAQASLLTLLGGAEVASEKARTAVITAGVPAVDDGQQLAVRLTDSIKAARDAYGKARNTVEHLPLTEEKPFYDGVASAMEVLREEYRPESTDPATLNSPALQAAFAGVQDCQSR